MPPQLNVVVGVLPEALDTDCGKCSDVQRGRARKVLRNLIEKEPDMYKELEAKYDPSGKYRNRYREEAKKEGVNI